MQSAKLRKIRWFLIGLGIILAIGWFSHEVEYASLPLEVRVEIEAVKIFRAMDRDIQWAIAYSQGKTVDQLSTMPYEYVSSKVLVGLLCAWGGAWAIYLAYSFFRFVDKERPPDPPTKQSPL